MANDGEIRITVDGSSVEDAGKKTAESIKTMAESMLEIENAYNKEHKRIQEEMEREDNAKAQRDYNYRISRARNAATAEKAKQDRIYEINKEANERYLEELKRAYEAEKEAFEQKKEEDFRNLSYYHKLGVISEEDYYSELERLRDEYFTEGTAEWQKYTLEILNYEKQCIVDITDDIASYASERFADVIEEKEKFHKKMLSSTDDFFMENTDTFKINGKKTEVTHTYLNNWEGEANVLKQYKEALQELKKRLSDEGFGGEIIMDFLSALNDMSVEDGFKFTTLLKNTSDEEFKKYVSDRSAYLKYAEEVADELYADEMERAMDDVMENTREKFNELGVDIPEDFFNIGVEGAKQFSNGFLKEVELFFDNLATKIAAYKMELTASLSSEGEASTVNNYQSSITINQSSSASQDISAYMAAEEVNRQRWLV